MTTKLTLTTKLKIPRTSIQIPQIGFGLYLSDPSVAAASCLHALRTGYRHIDSAQFYANEQQMGEAVRQSSLSRPEVFLTTKIMSAAGSQKRRTRSVYKVWRRLTMA